MTSENTREKMRQADHDLLIKLDVKVTDIGNDIKDLKDGFSARVASVEARLKNIEDKTLVIDPVSLPKDLEKIKRLEDRARIVLWLFAPIYLGVIGYLVTRFTGLFN